jgi:uncharacterized membrane protein
MRWVTPVEEEAAVSQRIEPRWTPLLALMVLTVLSTLLQSRVKVLPGWVPYVIIALAFVPMVVVQLTNGRPPWLRIERVTVLLVVVIVTPVTLAGLANIIRLILSQSAQISGQQLLASAIFAWITNVITFSLLYWWLDRGGPEARVARAGRLPDWRFPQQDAPPEDVRPDWLPTYVDYLFLSFSTSTAFSTTEVAPMTGRAKMLMMLEAAISLVTITAVAARAINVLGS